MQDHVNVKANCYAALNIVGLCLSALSIACTQSNPPTIASPQIMTVEGPIPVDSLGLTLIHEHVFLDWSGADSIDPQKWNEEEAFQSILPYLLDMKASGVRSFLECTPAYLGRNPNLLKRLAEASGLQILSNTGYYGARQNQYLPAHAHTSDATALANLWIGEFENGIEQSGVYPGFIKIGMDSKEPLTRMDRKLVQAAARTHLATGLTIVAHTGDDATAIQELQILQEEGVAPGAFVWTHAQNGSASGHVDMAKRGAWISLDGLGWIGPDSASQDSTALYKYVDFLKNLRENQLLHRVLISHDAGWYTAGEEDQSGFKAYTPIFDLLIPTLLREGFSDADVEQLLVENPKEAYGIGVRPYQK